MLVFMLMCVCVRSGKIGEVQWEGSQNKNEKPTSLQERWIYSFKACGCSFTSEISHLPLFPSSRSLQFLHPFIPLVILHIQRHFAVLLPFLLSQQTGPEMNPLSCIIYPQSKSLKKGLCHCVSFNREEALLCKPHLTRLQAFKV